MTIITIWVFEFYNNLSFWVSSLFEFLSFITIWVFNCITAWVFECYITIWVFEFHHNLRFWVSSQFEFLSFSTIWVFEFHHNRSFWVSSQLEFHHTLSFWVSSQFKFLSFMTIRRFWVFWWKKLFGEDKKNLIKKTSFLVKKVFWWKGFFGEIKEEFGHYSLHCHYCDFCYCRAYNIFGRKQGPKQKLEFSLHFYRYGWHIVK